MRVQVSSFTPINGSLAQWQSTRLLPGAVKVRVLQGLPNSAIAEPRSSRYANQIPTPWKERRDVGRAPVRAIVNPQEMHHEDLEPGHVPGCRLPVWSDRWLARDWHGPAHVLSTMQSISGSLAQCQSTRLLTGEMKVRILQGLPRGLGRRGLRFLARE